MALISGRLREKGRGVDRIALVEGRVSRSRRSPVAASWSARSTALEKPVRCICASWSTSTSPVARMSPWKPSRRRSRKAWL
jgi:hypothetical protein